MKSTFFIALFFHSITYAQKISHTEYSYLNKKEDSLKKISVKILQDSSLDKRIVADSLFTKIFVRALKSNNSFYFPFDSLFSISRLYAPDSSFKIFTWQLMLNENNYIQHGAIQMNTKDGALKLIPLFDKSDLIQDIETPITTNLNWIGAIYYKISETEYQGTKYYTLIGFDEYSQETNRKIIEVLHFENEYPVFGGDFFSLNENKSENKSISRYVMEYKKNAGPRLNYDDELKIIIKEHLISETKESNKKSTLIGEGEYDGFTWKDGKWIFLYDIFNTIKKENALTPPTKD